MTGGIYSRTCYTKLNFDFPYVGFLSLRRDPYVLNKSLPYNTTMKIILKYIKLLTHQKIKPAKIMRHLQDVFPFFNNTIVVKVQCETLLKMYNMTFRFQTYHK